MVSINYLYHNIPAQSQSQEPISLFSNNSFTEPISWGLADVCATHFLNKYTWVPWQIRKKTRLLDLYGTQPAVLCYGPRPSVPSPQAPALMFC